MHKKLIVLLLGHNVLQWECLTILLLNPQEADAAQRDVLERAEARVLAAEKEAATEREQRCRVMEAAANGNLPLVSTPGGMDLQQVLMRNVE